MSPEVYKAFASIAAEHYKDQPPAKVLEVGASRKPLLSIPTFARSARFALNLEFKKISPELEKCKLVVGNGNNMEFADNEFDCILSSATLEHDRYFWRTVDEMHRVLAAGGLLVIGVPIYMKLPTDFKHTTLTFARHGYKYNADYYRFSEQAMREVFFESFELSRSLLARKYPSPFMVMSGVKKA